MKQALATAALAAALGIGTVAFTAGSALADVVCNDEGDCWHVKQRPTYPSGVVVTVHPDDWKWGENEKFRWHEHEGSGYWRGGVWIGF